ncbi:hypothetical protein [Enterococcus cecorum]|uniref:Uncharacterized protein n=1 Tax=Enterococcus cecorum TaxID=44008 RepID=A0A0H2Q252_9ENTE|nr:hypothetical protein [Enterococcus cecorum]KLN93146.1 hypothetical protein ABT59_05095 [Enterococcus cecorum]KLN93416.1 hypothetical protein ABT60_06170 [Enterococcus cecorum]KLO65928.1 hypothetical protein AA985_06875 [Enterococcus cecorum]KLO72913.1 hypothetical protein AA987_00920 [Enterococcus cecorum]KLO73274.1 hypothetical protein AA988_00440 [Enterococcus cecorum]
MLLLEKMIIILTIITYLANYLTYLFMKHKKIKNGFERCALFLAVNMSLMLFDGLFAVIGKILFDELLLLE